jgi:hypothetical protein
VYCVPISELNDYLNSSPPLVCVHDACYWDYTNKRRYEQEADGETDMQDGLKAKLLRLSVETFSFKSNCFLCGKPAADSRHPDRCQVIGCAPLKCMRVCWPCASSDRISGRLMLWAVWKHVVICLLLMLYITETVRRAFSKVDLSVV